MNKNNINDVFDPIAWANRNNENDNEKKAAPKAPTQVVNSNADTEMEQILSVANQLIERCIDITDDYNDWLKLGFSLAHQLGEDGRQIFHNLSQISSKYNPADCDKQYDNCLRSHGQGVTISTFFHMAKDAGIDISEVAREAVRKERESLSLDNIKSSFCANSAKVPVDTNNENTAKNIEIAENEHNVQGGTMAHLAQTPENVDQEETVVDSGNTFSDKLRREDIPAILHPVYDSQTDNAGRDKMLLGTLNIISGLLPDSYYGKYDRRKVYAPIYNILYGRFATSKGDLEGVRHIATPLKREMRRKYEEQLASYEKEMAEWEVKNKKERGPQPKEPVLCSPFISANSSSAVVYYDLGNNGGWGVMFETEADSLTNMLSKSEYGDYSDLLRKTHHHETCSYKRKGDNISIEIDNPRLSILLTCTGSQLPALLPPGNVSNGLASRFLFYALPDAKIEFRNVFEGGDQLIEDIFKDLGDKFMPLYHALQTHKTPIQFLLSSQQKQQFVNTFNEVLLEQFYMLGDGIQGFIFRIALECFRYAMVLTALRRLSEWDGLDSLFDDDEQALVCDDRDFNTAMTIINCLVNHTGRVYAVLASQDNDPFRNTNEKPSDEIRRYYKALPDGRQFKTSEAMEVAKTLEMPERTAKRHLGEMSTKFQVLDRLSQGVYVKVNIAQ